jgi:hypothetical protein
MRELTVKVHEIAADGLPSCDTMDIAFIFDGCIVSGWPLYSGEDRDEEPFSGYWEANHDVGHNNEFSGVTHWIEFPEPLIDIERNLQHPARRMCLVVADTGGPVKAWPDRDRAHEYARNTGSVVVEVSIVADYSRTEEN